MVFLDPLDLPDLVVAMARWDPLVLPDLLDLLDPQDLPALHTTSSASPSRRRLPIPSVAVTTVLLMTPT